MALRFESRVVSSTTPTSTGTKDFTVGGGFTETPVGAIVFATRNTAVDTIEGAIAMSWGCTDGTAEYCGSFSDQDASATSNSQKAGSDDRVVWVLNATSGADLIVGSFDSFISGGIRINFTTVAGSARTIGAILFFGSDCECKAFTVVPMVSGDTDTVTTGFASSFVLTNAVPDLAETLDADMVIQLGMAIEDSLTQVVQIGAAEDGQGTSDTDSVLKNGILGWGADFGVAPVTAGHTVEIDQWNATTLRFASDGGGIITATPRLIGLAVRASDVAVQLDTEELTPTSISDDVFTTNFRVGFAYATSARNTTGDTLQTAMMIGVGGSDVLNLAHVSMGANSRHAVTTMVCDTVFDDELIHTTTANGTNDLIIASPDAGDDTSVDLAFTKIVATPRVFSALWVGSPKNAVVADVVLPALTASGTVTQRFAVAAPVALPAMTAAASVTQRFAVASAADLPALEAAGAALLRFAVTAATVLPALTASGTAATRYEVAAPVVLPALTAGGAVTQRFKVDALAVLPALTATGAVSAGFTVVAPVVLPALTASGAVVLRFAVTAPATLPALTASGSVAARFEVTAAVVLPALAAGGAVVVRFTVAAAVDLPAMTAGGAVVTRFEVNAPVVLPAMISSGAVFVGAGSSTAIAECITLAAGRQLVFNLAAGRRSVIGLEAGRSLTENLAGGLCSVKTLAAGRRQTVSLEGGQNVCD